MAQKNNKRGGNTNRNRGNNSKFNKRDNRDSKDYQSYDIKANESRSFNKNDNDPSWYAVDQALMRDAASLPFSYSLGMVMNRKLGDDNVKLDLADAIPGVMAAYCHSLPGISRSASDPINIAVKNVYSYLRYWNSGAANYEGSDLMMYILALDSCYAMIAHAVRAYGVSRTYSQVNRYYPATILQAMNFNDVDVQNNLANFRMGINTAINKIASLAVPNTMPFFTRHMWMYSYLWADDAHTAKSQTYMYSPSTYYVFRSAKEETGSSLECKQFKNAGGVHKLYTVQEYLNILFDMIGRLVEDEDINIMSGDIIKAYKPEGLLRMPSVDENYTVTSQYSPEVLTQINNLITLGDIAEDSGDINQVIRDLDTIIVCDPKFRNEFYGAANPAQLKADLILNMPMEGPTPADVMVATRLMVIPDRAETINDGTDTYLALSACGSDVCCTVEMWTFTKYNGLPKIEHWPFKTYQIIDTTTAMDESTIIYDYTLMAMWSKFHAHPRVYIYTQSEISDGKLMALPTFGDVQTYTILDSNTLNKMHTTAILSELNVPLMGGWSKR